MQISEFLDLLGDNVSYEYQGSTTAPFRGLGLKSERRGVRRCLYVLPEVDWHPEYPRMLRKDERPVELEFETAISNGASGIVCPPKYRNHPLLQGQNCLFVDNTLEFTYQAARAIRRSLNRQKLIAITGSAGKSTTKLMLADALKALRPDHRIQAVRENRNIAAQVLWQTSWAHGYDYSVLEVAGSALLRFPEVPFTLSPNVAIITSISEAHLDYLGDLRGVAEHKGHIFDDAPKGGVGLVNLDAAHSDLLIDRGKEGGYEVVTYGESPGADLRLMSYSPATGAVVAERAGQQFEYQVGAHGRHMAVNSLAVIGALEALGFEDLQPALDALASFKAASGRGEVLDVVLDTGAAVHITDESFNSNPASVRAAVSAFASKPQHTEGRKIVVLGDIRELGAASAEVHRALHDTPGLDHVDQLHLFGEEMRHLYDAVQHQSVHYWQDLDALVSAVVNNLRTGDQVLVKASHSTGLNAFVKSLAAE